MSVLFQAEKSPGHTDRQPSGADREADEQAHTPEGVGCRSHKFRKLTETLTPRTPRPCRRRRHASGCSPKISQGRLPSGTTTPSGTAADVRRPRRLWTLSSPKNANIYGSEIPLDFRNPSDEPGKADPILAHPVSGRADFFH